MTAFGVALVAALGSFAIADNRDDKAAEQRGDAAKELNQGQQMKWKQEESSAPNLGSLEKDLRDRLGKDWSVRKSSTGYTAIRVVTQKPMMNFDQKIGDEMKSFREHHKDAMASNSGSEVAVRGRIDDCNDAARAVDGFANIKGVDRITVDISCGSIK
jgi:hypothetical protein